MNDGKTDDVFTLLFGIQVGDLDHHAEVAIDPCGVTLSIMQDAGDGPIGAIKDNAMRLGGKPVSVVDLKAACRFTSAFRIRPFLKDVSPCSDAPAIRIFSECLKLERQQLRAITCMERVRSH